MKNTLTILSIALLSTTAQAEINADVVEAKQEVVSNLLQTKNADDSEIEQAKKLQSNVNLWNTLDTNKDGTLSKTEATSSIKVIASWDKLDLNKDQKLDTEEFGKIYSLEN